MNTGNPRLLLIAPFVFLCLWSGGYVVAKVGLAFAEPMTLLVFRFVAVVLIMLVIFVFLRPPLPERLIDWVHLAIVGFLIQAVYFGMCYLGFNAGIAAGTMALLMSLQPILVGLVAPRWSGEVVGWRRWSGLGLGLLGTAIVIIARSDIEPPTLFGLLCAIIALAGITGGTLWEKRFGLSHHPVTANLFGYTAGLIGVAPLMFLQESMHVEWNWTFVGALAYLVIGNSIIAVGLLLAMIRAGDVSRVSALFFLIPPLAAIMAWFVLGEVMPPTAWFGIIIAAIGVFIATRRQSTGPG
ncbi:multidrug DMT transporter permease [Chromatiales bacterium (ex Bugula neritina AB1)]|nr:multidrug DMT transporter permease [Chromatiales bacterium (ex Bugula neritina AB1)]